jgi:ABC-type Fe3+ transport system substrate-binding protein
MDGLWRALALATAMAVIAAACGGQGQAPAAPAASAAASAATGPVSALDQAKKDAAAKGMAFAGTHDEIVAKAKDEGSLRALLSFGKEVQTPIIAGFTKIYPFIKLEIQETTGSEAQRFLLELQAGTDNAKSWDITNISSELYKDVAPFVAPIDVLGMSQQKVLAIEPKMVDPGTRGAFAAGSATGGYAYNKKLLSADKLPKTWEDFLKPEFKGKKFWTDIEPTNFAGLVPLKGEAYVIDLAKKIAAQQPVWVRGDTKALTSMAAGEYQLSFASNYHSAQRALALAPDALGVVVLDPAPVRLAQLMGILKTAKHPYSALLLFEWFASPDGQKLLDDTGPYQSSVYATGSKVNQAVQGKQISVVGWAEVDKLAAWQNKIVEAWGFPKAETK